MSPPAAFLLWSLLAPVAELLAPALALSRVPSAGPALLDPLHRRADRLIRRRVR